MAVSDEDFTIALTHYRLIFPDAASLGAGTPHPDKWWEEYGRVSAEGLAATLFVQNAYEGGSSTAQKNFDQRAVLRALVTRRAELDADFDDAVFAPPAVKSRASYGHLIRLGGCY
jgi:hypothetical protein